MTDIIQAFRGRGLAKGGVLEFLLVTCSVWLPSWLAINISNSKFILIAYHLDTGPNVKIFPITVTEGGKKYTYIQQDDIFYSPHHFKHS